MKPPVRIYLIHRYRLLADALAQLLAARPELQLVGVASHWHAAGPAAAEPVDVLLLDAEPAADPGQLIREIKRQRPRLKVLPLGLEHQREIVELLEAGASGYVPRAASFAELVQAICGVHHGEAPCSPQIAASVIARLVELSAAEPARAPRPKRRRKVRLTAREREVLRLVAAGLQNKEIAHRLEISVPTVKNHVHKILEKFQVNRRREAVQIACESGYIDDPLPSTEAT